MMEHTTTGTRIPGVGVSSVTGVMNSTGAFFIASAVINLFIMAVVVLSHAIRIFAKSRQDVKTRTSSRLVEITNQSPLLLPQILTDQLLTLALLFVAVYSLATTTILQHPFLSDALPAVQSNLIVILLAVNTGRYIAKLGFRLHTAGEVKRKRPFLWVDVMHHAVTITCFLVLIHTRQNWISGLVFILMDADILLFNITRVLKLFGCPRQGTAFTAVTFTGLIVGVFSRTLVPVALFGVACSHQSPFVISPVSLAALFAAAMFLGIVNIWFLMTSVNSLRKCLRARRKANSQKMSASHTCLQKVVVDAAAKISLPAGFGDLKLNNTKLPQASVIKNNLGDLKGGKKNVNKPLNLDKPSSNLKAHGPAKQLHKIQANSKTLYTIPEDCPSETGSAQKTDV